MMSNYYKLYFLFSLVCFFFLPWFECKSLVVYLDLMKSFNLSSKLFQVLLMFDWVVCFFFGVLFLICGSVGKFSVYYMMKDNKNLRFFYLMKIFVFSMVLLLILPSYIFFLVGWDGLGFSSFLLMKYYKSAKSWSSSFKTFLINRFGDGLLLASMGIFLYQGHFFFFFEETQLILFFLLLLGLLTKSAHFPFSSWLPAAMAAPTPVSALVHSSTLVTAGMYMLLRLCYFLPNSMNLMFYFMAISTVFLGSFSAFMSFDSKKVVAYSTLSNLGVMGVGMSLGFIGLSFFHLLAHGVSKALLFINTGKMMKKNNHMQDLRGFSNKWQSNILTKVLSIWSVFSLAGIYFLSCFFSKDVILEASLAGLNILNLVLFKLSFFFTFMYSFRLLSFFQKKKNQFKMFFFKNFISMKMLLSSMPLFIFVMSFGGCFKSLFMLLIEESESLKFYIMMIIFISSLCFQNFSFKFIKNYNYFNSSFFFWVSYVGKYLYNIMDQGMLSYFLEKISLKFNQKIFFFNLKNLSYNLNYYYIFIMLSLSVWFFFN